MKRQSYGVRAWRSAATAVLLAAVVLLGVTPAQDGMPPADGSASATGPSTGTTGSPATLLPPASEASSELLTHVPWGPHLKRYLERVSDVSVPADEVASARAQFLESFQRSVDSTAATSAVSGPAR